MRVLMASDLSEASDEALRQGLAMANGGQLALCHVMPELGTHALLAQQYEEDLKEQLSVQPQLAEALRAQFARVAPAAVNAPEVFIELGSDHEQIVRRALEWHADLIVLGSHGKTGLKRLLLGSVADQVVRAAHCAVLVTRAPREGAILAATDLTDPALPAIEAAGAEALRRGRKLVVMHAMATARDGDAAIGLMGMLPALETPEVREARRNLAAQIIETELDRLDVLGEVLVVEQDTLAEILRLATTLPAELIVVGTHARRGLARIALGSMAAHVIERAPCSVLVTRLKSSDAPPA